MIDIKFSYRIYWNIYYGFIFILYQFHSDFYQMKISFLPALHLGFNQILLEREKDQLNIMNSATEEHHHKDYIKLYNLGGGAAKKNCNRGFIG